MQLLPNTAADCSGLWFSPTSQARSHSCLCPPIAYPFPPEASTQSGPELPGLEGEYSYPAKAPWAWGESLATHLPLLQRVLHHSLSPQQRHLPSLYSLPLFQNFSFSLWANCLADSQPLWKTDIMGTSILVQWIKICLPMQGKWVQTLIWEDTTCLGATEPMCHNYWGCTLEPASRNY